MQSVCDRDRPITPPPPWTWNVDDVTRAMSKGGGGGGGLVNVQGGVFFNFSEGGQCPRGVPVNVQEWGRFSN